MATYIERGPEKRPPFEPFVRRMQRGASNYGERVLDALFAPVSAEELQNEIDGITQKIEDSLAARSSVKRLKLHEHREPERGQMEDLARGNREKLRLQKNKLEVRLKRKKRLAATK